MAANRSDVSRNGTIGNWEYTDYIQVTSEFIEGKNLYPYSLALSDGAGTSAVHTGVTDASDNVILVGLKFKIDPKVADTDYTVLNITITPTAAKDVLENGSCFLWRYEETPAKPTVAAEENAARGRLSEYTSATIADNLTTALGGTTTVATGAAELVTDNLTPNVEHAIYVYLKSDTSWDANKEFSVKLWLDETDSGDLGKPVERATMGLYFSYNAGLGGYEVSRGTANPGEHEGTIYVPSTYDGSNGTLPVVKVGYYGFMSSTMTGIVLPKTVTDIGDSAFYRCGSLTTVYVLSEIPPTLLTGGDSVFYNSNNLTHIYVPAGSVVAYKTAWSDYADIISAILPEA